MAADRLADNRVDSGLVLDAGRKAQALDSAAFPAGRLSIQQTSDNVYSLSVHNRAQLDRRLA